MYKSITTLLVGLALAATAVTASADTPKGKLGAASAGKLVQLKDGKVSDFTQTASPDYYVVYHSASW